MKCDFVAQIVDLYKNMIGCSVAAVAAAVAVTQNANLETRWGGVAQACKNFIHVSQRHYEESPSYLRKLERNLHMMRW